MTKDVRIKILEGIIYVLLTIPMLYFVAISPTEEGTFILYWVLLSGAIGIVESYSVKSQNHFMYMTIMIMIGTVILMELSYLNLAPQWFIAIASLTIMRECFILGFSYLDLISE